MSTPVGPRRETDDLILKELKTKYPDAEICSRTPWADRLGGEAFYYIEFKTKDLKTPDSWYWAFVRREGSRLLETTDEVVSFMQVLWDRSVGLKHKLREFELWDIVGAIIAILLVLTFVVTVFVNQASPDKVSKEFLGVITLVVGYYFGRGVQTAHK
jgi:hypothetical protein